MKIAATHSTTRIDITEGRTRELAAEAMARQLAGQLVDLIRANADLSVADGKRIYSINMEVKLTK